MNQWKCHSAVLYRLSMCSLAIVLWLITILEPRSILALYASTAPASFMLAATAVIGLIGVLDVLINDVLPDRFIWRLAERHRHFILVSLAFCYIAGMYISVAIVRSNALNLFFTWNAVSLLSLAFSDARHRHKDICHERERSVV